jgi:hypothetical protein
MGADIEPGPIEDGLNWQSLDRHTDVGGDSRAIEREQAQAHARDYALPGSAASVHRTNISSASIPAISFVINAITPAP